MYRTPVRGAIGTVVARTRDRPGERSLHACVAHVGYRVIAPGGFDDLLGVLRSAGFLAVMMSESWRSLFVRSEPDTWESYDALHEGVPVWLMQSLLPWIELVVTEDDPVWGVVRSIRVGLIGRMARALRRELPENLDDLVAVLSDDAELALEAVDFLLHLGTLSSSVSDLGLLLDESSSAWRVNNDATGLERRISEQVTDTANVLLAAGGRPAEHLREAWTRAFGKAADPSGAYREAVRAVEAALQPVISPKDGSATLGKMIVALRDAPAGKFTVRLDPQRDDVEGVAIFRQMLELLWTAQLDRHGTADEKVPLTVTDEQAQDASVLASTILYFVSEGAFRRTEPASG